MTRFDRDQQHRPSRYEHVVLQPLPSVLHIHFKLPQDAHRCVRMLGPRVAEVAVEAGNSWRDDDDWKGICLSYDKWIAPEIQSKPARFDSIMESIVRRELGSYSGKLAIVVTCGSYGCSHWLFRHETAHAFWNLNDLYRERAAAVMAKLSPALKGLIQSWLQSQGYYDQGVPPDRLADHIMDEMQAHIYAGERFEREADAARDKLMRERRYHRAKLCEIMDEVCPRLNRVGMLEIRKWRDRNDRRQIAQYRLWVEGELCRCVSLEVGSPVYSKEDNKHWASDGSDWK